MADAAVAFLLENLKQLFLYNAKLMHGIKGEVKSLDNDLSLFKAFLVDSTEKRRSKNETMRELDKQIRNEVYEAEDAIDLFVTQAAAHQARTPLRKFLHMFHYAAQVRSVAGIIEGIRKKVKDIYEDKRFGFEAVVNGSHGIMTKQKKPPVVEEDNVVGFEDEAEKVINLLTGGSDELQVISIIGMPGLGKTTLAKMIYRDPKIEYEFYSRAWVYVSQDYSRKELFLNILGNFTQLTDTMYKMNDENLAKKLYRFLEKAGKYLIVLDDVWTEEAWNDLKIAFPKNNKRSRILITSRIKKVAKHTNPNGEPHNLRLLTREESWRLLQSKALGAHENCPDELVKDGLHMAKECQGLPLALVVIGGILLDKGTDWWEKVARSVDAFIAMDQEKRMHNLIALSYNQLPYHLKACFIYFGMFPEDFEIPVWKLLRLWIAEGFIIQQNINQQEMMSLEDVAEEYLEDLVNRNLVMVGQLRSNGKIKTCRIHNMLHKFCKKEAADENFFQEIKRFDQLPPSNLTSENYRHLCIHSPALNYISSKPAVGPHVRSLLCFSEAKEEETTEHSSSLPGAFKLLRVLDAQSITFTRFPTDLTHLVHLRYIVLSINFKTLPEAISSLWNIQTLVVIQTSSSPTLEIKADIWKMFQLRHVKTNVSTSLPAGPLSKTSLSGGSLLQTLSTISPESCTEDVFARAPKLKNLGIRGQLSKLLENKSGSMLFDSLGKLSHLESLKLMNDVFPRLTSLPQRHKFPPNLRKLTLSDTLLDWKHMSTLGMLENLEILKLKDNAFKGEWWQPDDGGFRSLRVLHIGRTDLVSWNASANHFPRLRHLFLRHCNSLASLPLAFGDLVCLQLLVLYCTTQSAAASARKIQHKKKMMQVQGKQQSIRPTGFKLSIYPPDQ